MLFLLVAYLILGAVFDEIAAMLITLPFVLPIIVKLGYDAVWWGIINVVVVELGMIIPPIGIIVFLLHGLAPQIAMRTIYRGVMPVHRSPIWCCSVCSRCFPTSRSRCRGP